MRIFLAAFLPLAVTAEVESQPGNLPPSAINISAAASPLLVANNHNLDGAIDKESRLRGSQELASALSSIQRDHELQEIPDVVDFGDLSSVERIEKVEELQSKLNVWVSKLTEVEMMAVSNGVMEFTSIIRNAQAGLQKLDKPVAKIVELLQLEQEHEQEGTMEEQDMRHLVAVSPEGRAIAVQDNKQKKRDKTTTNKKHKEQRNQYRRAFDEQRQRAKTFHSSHFHHKMADLQEAIFNGDHAAVREFTNSVLQSHYSRYGRRNGASTTAGRRRLDKAEMCTQLVDCATKMSKYDMFVYFYSDDIDPTTGEVDDNIVKYDEEDLNKKYDKIKELASNKTCDALLQQFHRTKENGNVPSWEGATVGQVCLAEGTATFVKLEDAAKTLAFTPAKLIAKALDAKQDLSKGNDSVLRKDLDAIFKKVTGGYPDLVANLVIEPIACAEKMWGGKESNEHFPFGEEGKPIGLAEKMTQAMDRRTVDGLMSSARFPTFKGEEDFPTQVAAKETWRRQLAVPRANYKITLKDIYLKSNGDSGSEAEIYGKIWVTVNDRTTYLWDKSEDHYWNVRGGGRRDINQVHTIENFDTKNGKIEVGCHLWEDDNGGDDDFGRHTREVSSSEEFYLRSVDGGSDVRVNWSIEREDINVGLEMVQSDARNEFGQVRNNKASPYKAYVPYKYLSNRYQLCAQKLSQKVMKDLTQKDKDGDDIDLKKVLDEDFFEPFFKDCLGDFFGAMREGIELVFGDRTSTGFICGMKEAIVNGGKELPGTCCLDAPYELEGDDWGREYQCPVQGETSRCKIHGPYFSGMSTQACDSYGGTWCANEVDCSVLKACIDKNKETAKQKNRSFFDYLDSAPTIQDPTSFKQCGRTREYFGYDKYFSNDAQVCEGVEQLKQMKDFSFIDEFYNTGGDSEEEPQKPREIDPEELDDKETKTISPSEAGEAPEPPPEIEAPTEEPDYTQSENPLVKSGAEWYQAIFAQEQVYEGTESALEFADNVACPDLPFVGTFPCELVKTIVKAVLLVVKKVTGALLKISAFMKKIKAEIDNIMPIKEAEQTEAVTKNVAVTHQQVTEAAKAINQYIYESFTALFKDVYEKNKASNDYLKQVDQDQTDTMKEYFDTQTKFLEKVADQDRDSLFKIREDIQEVQTDCVKKIVPGISFDMQAVVTSKGDAKSFVVVTTGLDGKPTKPDFFDIKSVGADGTSSMVSKNSFTPKNIGSAGEQFIKLHASVKENVFIVSAGLYEENTDEELVTKTVLLSFH